MTRTTTDIQPQATGLTVHHENDAAAYIKSQKPIPTALRGPMSWTIPHEHRRANVTSVIAPFAKWEPSPNHGGAMSAVLGVVIHVTAGESDPGNWFSNPLSQVSAHFGIGNGQGGMADGEVAQYVDTDLQSWAQEAGNAGYWSVETEGQPGDPLTTNQILSFARIYAWAVQVKGLPLNITDTVGAQGLITHGDGGVPWGDHVGCPGPQRSAERAAIIYIAALTLGPPQPPSREDENRRRTAFDPTSGGFWATDQDGHLQTNNGAPFTDDLANHPNYAAGQDESGGKLPCVGIEAFKDMNAEIGTCYVTRMAGTTDQSGLRYFRFSRRGQPD